MKHIVKTAEPQEFSDWKAMANNDWEPTYDNLSGIPKKAVKVALMSEQGYICCYCERRLTDGDSHIEHFRPQSDSAVSPLDFNNMLCSCQSQLQKGDPRHCGNLKDNWCDDHLIISPFDSGCEGRFSFTADGKIGPADETDQAAKETIKRLGLDIPKVNALRKQVIEPFLDDSLNDSDLKEFVKGYLQKYSNGMFGEFWTTINYLFGTYATT